jgi:hypothetical protein
MGYLSAIKYVEVGKENRSRFQLKDTRHSLEFVYSSHSRYFLRATSTKLSCSCRVNLARSETTWNLKNDSSKPIGHLRFDNLRDGIDPSKLEFVGVVIAGTAERRSPLFPLLSNRNAMRYTDFSLLLIVERITKQHYRRRGLACVDTQYLKVLESPVIVY